MSPTSFLALALCSTGDCEVVVVVVSGFRDCVALAFVSIFNISVGFSLLALRALLSVFTLDEGDLPASRREPSEERTNLHRFDGIS